ncbi:MAG: helix-turn-helix domain-containing protein [Dechloromonas sp.]|nr:helix-turn-helix domain-containing protein [Dechloromonas sp.]
MTPQNKKAAPGANRAAQETTSDKFNLKPPLVTGQCGQVLNLIHQQPGIVSLVMTADYAIPEAAARVHDLRAAGWNILTTIHPTVIFRGVERHNVATYSLGTPGWPRPGFFDVREG